MSPVTAFSNDCLKKAAACRANGWPPEYEEVYLRSAADWSIVGTPHTITQRGEL